MEIRRPGTSPARRPNVDSPRRRIDDRDIVAISRGTMEAMDSDGARFPITARFDRFGDETDDWAETTACVAGPDPRGHHWAFDVADYGGEAN